jgi:hypothetical protein
MDDYRLIFEERGLETRVTMLRGDRRSSRNHDVILLRTSPTRGDVRSKMTS